MCRIFSSPMGLRTGPGVKSEGTYCISVRWEEPPAPFGGVWVREKGCLNFSRTEVQGSVSKDRVGDQGGGFACAPFILVKMVIQRTQRRPQNHRKHTQVRKPPPRENIGIHSTLGGRLQDDFKGNPKEF